MEHIREHYLLVTKFCTKNVLYNFYVKRTVMEKNVQVTKNAETVLQILLSAIFQFPR